MIVINKRTKILEHIIPHRIPGFTKNFEHGESYVLSPKLIDCETWFEDFSNKVIASIGKNYLPIMRLSDGEYQFICGPTPPVFTKKIGKYVIEYLKFLKEVLLKYKGVHAATFKGVSSGNYTNQEVKEYRGKYLNHLKKISNHGILAMHLTYSKNPFQQKYHAPVKNKLEAEKIQITFDNYVPFYFVYGLMTGEKNELLIKNRKILLIHSAKGEKKQNIESFLITNGAKSVQWVTISNNKSLFDTISIEEFKNNIDLAFIGAGIGKTNILIQLEELSVPCIDIGFVFECWNDENLKWTRPFMVDDEKWNDSKIQF